MGQEAFLGAEARRGRSSGRVATSGGRGSSTGSEGGQWLRHHKDNTECGVSAESHVMGISTLHWQGKIA